MLKDKSSDEKISCPCKKKCVLYYHRNKIKAYDHLMVNSIMAGYDGQNFHGESISIFLPTINANVEKDTCKGDDMLGMFNDTFGAFGQVVDMDISEKILT